MHLYIHVVISLSFLQLPVESLICYSCTSALDSSIDKNAQLAMRIFLDASYKLPPVNRLCNMEEDIEFKTIPTVQCSISDKCVKVEAKNQGDTL